LSCLDRSASGRRLGIHPEVAEDLIVASRAAGQRSLQGPRAVSVRYLPARDRVEIDLASGWSVEVPRTFSARLALALPEDCERVEMVDSGLGLHWPSIDEVCYVQAVSEALSVPSAA